jgi:transposase InsO family protein
VGWASVEKATTIPSYTIAVIGESPKEWEKEQGENEKIQKPIELVYLPDDLRTEREKQTAKFYKMEDGLLMRKRVSQRETRWNVVVPPRFQQDLICAFHDRAAHVGRNKTLAALKERYYWKGMGRHVAQYIRECHNCQIAKARIPLKAGTLKSKEVVGTNHTLSIDINGPHPKANGYEYILTIVDCFSRWCALIPMRKTTAGAVANAIYKEWIRHHSCPVRILTDQGPQFNGKVMQRLCDRLGVKKVKTSAYHPQTNAQAERIHRFLKSSLIALVEKDPKKWYQMLPYVEFAYRTTEVDGIGLSPFQMMYGRKPTMPTDLYLASPFTFTQDRQRYHLNHTTNIVKMRKHIEEQQRKINSKATYRYDDKHFDVVFEVGSKVLVYMPPRVKGPSKLFEKVRGPFTVVGKLPSGVVYEVVHDTTKKKMQVHVQRMVLYHEREPDIEQNQEAIHTPEPRRRSLGEREEQNSSPSPVDEREQNPLSLSDDEREEQNSSPSPDDEREEQNPLSLSDDEREGVDQEPHSNPQSDLEEDGKSEEEESGEHVDHPLMEKKTLMLKNIVNTTNPSVFIETSSIEGAGLGVFAKTILPEKTILGEYLGETLNNEQYEARYPDDDGKYTIALGNGNFLDARDPERSSWHRWINDHGPTAQPNCAYVEDPNTNRVFIRVIKRIEPREELLASYGKEFPWEEPPKSPNQDKRPQVPNPEEGPINEEPQQAYKENQFVVIKEPAEPYRLGEIITVDPLGEFLEVRLWGSYDQRKPLKERNFRPAWVDPKDDKAIFHSRGRRAWSPWTMLCTPKEVKTKQSFILTSRRKVPARIAEEVENVLQHVGPRSGPSVSQ